MCSGDGATASPRAAARGRADNGIGEASPNSVISGATSTIGAAVNADSSYLSSSSNGAAASAQKIAGGSSTASSPVRILSPESETAGDEILELAGGSAVGGGSPTIIETGQSTRSGGASALVGRARWVKGAPIDDEEDEGDYGECVDDEDSDADEALGSGGNCDGVEQDIAEDDTASGIADGAEISFSPVSSQHSPPSASSPEKTSAPASTAESSGTNSVFSASDSRGRSAAAPSAVVPAAQEDAVSRVDDTVSAPMPPPPPPAAPAVPPASDGGGFFARLAAAKAAKVAEESGSGAVASVSTVAAVSIAASAPPIIIAPAPTAPQPLLVEHPAPPSAVSAATASTSGGGFFARLNAAKTTEVAPVVAPAPPPAPAASASTAGGGFFARLAAAQPATASAVPSAAFVAPDGRSFSDRGEYRKYLFETFYSWRGVRGSGDRDGERASRTKAPGDVSGQPFSIEDCSDAELRLLDWSETVQVDRCERCRVFIAASCESVFLRNISDCVVTVAAKQLRMRDCSRVTVYLYAKTDPIVEASSLITFAPFNGACSGLAEAFSAASLDPRYNHWKRVFDFSKDDTSLPTPHWSLQGASFITRDFIRADWKFFLPPPPHTLTRIPLRPQTPLILRSGLSTNPLTARLFKIQSREIARLSRPLKATEALIYGRGKMLLRSSSQGGAKIGKMMLLRMLFALASRSLIVHFFFCVAFTADFGGGFDFGGSALPVVDEAARSSRLPRVDGGASTGSARPLALLAAGNFLEEAFFTAFFFGSESSLSDELASDASSDLLPSSATSSCPAPASTPALTPAASRISVAASSRIAAAATCASDAASNFPETSCTTSFVLAPADLSDYLETWWGGRLESGRERISVGSRDHLVPLLYQRNCNHLIVHNLRRGDRRVRCRVVRCGRRRWRNGCGLCLNRGWNCDQLSVCKSPSRGCFVKCGEVQLFEIHVSGEEVRGPGK